MSGSWSQIFGGSMLVAGTAIGAGMLGLPIISAGMWFFWSTALLVVSWFCMYRSSQAILEVNLHFEPGRSFHTLTRDLLGRSWSMLNGLSVAFVLYTLVYAYVSGGGSVVQHMMTPPLGMTPSRLLSSLFFALLMSACIWWSSKAVDRLTALLMGGMILSLIISMSGMFTHIKMSILSNDGHGGQFIFVWCAVSTYLTSFCFHASVPSLVKYMGQDGRSINKCLRYGTLIALLCYFAWIVACDGIIPRSEYPKIVAAGGNVGNLLVAAGDNLANELVLRFLEAFSLMAVATSFLGAGLGLFDYMADLCNFDDSRMGRTKTMIVTLVPPMICGIIWPDGFLPAIAWAGFAACVWSVITPALLLRAGRRKFTPGGYVAPGGRLLVPLLLCYGILVAVCHILFVFELLPMYQ